MISPRTPPRRLLCLRPGALGDVLLLRAALGYAHRIWEGCRITLLAPGERGRLLHAPGVLADEVLDLDRAEAAWLFAETPGAPPDRLRAPAAGCDLAVAYVRDGGGTIRANLQRLGWGRIEIHPPHPGDEYALHAQRHLCTPLVKYAARHLGAQPARTILESALREPPPVPTDPAAVPAQVRRTLKRAGAYAVFHPGSGSPRKNWPLPCFVEVGRALAKRLRVVVTAGEADGTLGRQLARAVPGALLCEGIPLAGLAALLADASLYLGNDSGVSHLAAAARPPGRRSACVVLFGPTPAAIWAPPGSTILCAPGGEPERLAPNTVTETCLEKLER